MVRVGCQGSASAVIATELSVDAGAPCGFAATRPVTVVSQTQMRWKRA